jgi:hypothetical protein
MPCLGANCPVLAASMLDCGVEPATSELGEMADAVPVPLLLLVMLDCVPNSRSRLRISSTSARRTACV